MLSTFLFSINLISAEEFGYGRTEDIPINYSEIPTVNNSLLFDGYTTTGYRAWIQTYFNNIYCQLTGCEMIGDIDMNRNDILDADKITATDISNFSIFGLGDVEDSADDLDFFQFNATSGTWHPVSIETIYYNATSGVSIAGTLTGYINATQHPDGDHDGVTLNITEQSGTPGLDVRVNFTNGITRFNNGYMRYRTDLVSSANPPIIQLWNYDDNDWEDQATLGENPSFVILEQGIFDDLSHVQDGTVQMRLYKSSAGNTNNDYFIDWLAISKGFGSPIGNEIDPNSIHKDGTTVWEGNDDHGGYNITNVSYINGENISNKWNSDGTSTATGNWDIDEYNFSLFGNIDFYDYINTSLYSLVESKDSYSIEAINKTLEDGYVFSNYGMLFLNGTLIGQDFPIDEVIETGFPRFVHTLELYEDPIGSQEGDAFIIVKYPRLNSHYLNISYQNGGGIATSNFLGERMVFDNPDSSSDFLDLGAEYTRRVVYPTSALTGVLQYNIYPNFSDTQSTATAFYNSMEFGLNNPEKNLANLTELFGIRNLFRFYNTHNEDTTIENVYGVYSSIYQEDGFFDYPMNLTNVYGFYSSVESGIDPINEIPLTQNAYGLYIDDVEYAENNFGIKTNKGLNELADTTYITQPERFQTENTLNNGAFSTNLQNWSENIGGWFWSSDGGGSAKLIGIRSNECLYQDVNNMSLEIVEGKIYEVLIDIYVQLGLSTGNITFSGNYISEIPDDIDEVPFYVIAKNASEGFQICVTNTDAGSRVNVYDVKIREVSQAIINGSNIDVKNITVSNINLNGTTIDDWSDVNITDTNASTACSTDEVLLGNGTCLSSSSFGGGIENNTDAGANVSLKSSYNWETTGNISANNLEVEKIDFTGTEGEMEHSGGSTSSILFSTTTTAGPPSSLGTSSFTVKRDPTGHQMFFESGSNIKSFIKKFSGDNADFEISNWYDLVFRSNTAEILFEIGTSEVGKFDSAGFEVTGDTDISGKLNVSESIEYNGTLITHSNFKTEGAEEETLFSFDYPTESLISCKNTTGNMFCNGLKLNFNNNSFKWCDTTMRDAECIEVFEKTLREYNIVKSRDITKRECLANNYSYDRNGCFEMVKYSATRSEVTETYQKEIMQWVNVTYEEFDMDFNVVEVTEEEEQGTGRFEDASRLKDNCGIERGFGLYCEVRESR